MWSSALPSLSLFSSPYFTKSKEFRKRPKKFTPSMWKARCSKTLVGKHFLFGALAWHTGDARHKALLSPLPLNASVLQRGAPWSPGRCDGDIPAPVSLLLFVQNSSPWVELLLQQMWRDFFWVLFGRFQLLLLFGICFWGGFCRTEEGVTHDELQDLCCALWARPEADKD